MACRYGTTIDHEQRILVNNHHNHCQKCSLTAAKNTEEKDQNQSSSFYVINSIHVSGNTIVMYATTKCNTIYCM